MREFLIAGVGLIAGCLLGIVVQRFYPVGQMLAVVGLRDILPIPRNVPQDKGLAVQEWDVPVEDRGRLLLFVLMGQSNMSGRGSLDSPNVPQSHPSIYALNKDYRWYLAREPLGTATGEVDWIATDGGTGVGPGLAFARELLELDPKLKIGLIPCARGASSVEEWQPNRSQNSLYGACLKRIYAASTYGKVAGVLFSQGESDADNPSRFPGRVLSPDTWRAKFESVVMALRVDLSEPDLPVFFAQLGDYRGDTLLPYWETVKQQQAQVKMPDVTMIVTEDLPLQPDGHLNTESNVEIGRRFAAAYCAVTSECLK